MTLLQRTRQKTPIPTTIDNTPDTFTAAWGATTQWKSGRPRGPRTPPQTLPANPGAVHPTPIASTGSTANRTPQVRASTVLQLNKPLPPLPPEALVGLRLSSEDDHRPHERINISSDEDRATSHAGTGHSIDTSRSSQSSVPLGVKRKPMFGFVRSKSKKQKSEPMSNQPSRPDMSQASSRPLEDKAPTRIEIPPPHSVEDPHPRMVDQGTQTSPGLERQYFNWYTQQANSTKVKSTDSDSPRSSSRTPKSPSNFPTPTAAMRTPLWSPRNFMKPSNPYDYFTLPSEKVETVAGQDSSLATKGNKLWQPYYTIHGSPSPRRRSDTDATTGSGGSYDSKYSELPIQKQKSMERPTLKRKVSSSSTIVHLPGKADIVSIKQATVSEQMLPTVLAASSSSPAVSPLAAPPTTHTTKQASPSNRPLPSPFQKKNYSGRRTGSSAWSDSSNTTPPSPLRQEVKHANSPPIRTDRQASFGFFRVPLHGSTPPLDTPDNDVPDHFLGSPLCPMSPKHKSGGWGICPYHGRRKSDAEDGDGAYEYTPGGTKKELEDDEDDEFWRRMQGGGSLGWTNEQSRGKGKQGLRFELTMGDHEENSAQCPAHPRYQGPGGRGVCIFHGRWRNQAASDDSIPRVSIK